MKTHRPIRQLILAALLLPPLLGGVQAQDNLWVYGNQLLDFNTELDPNNQPYPTKVCNLPIGPDAWDYQGQAAQYSQNAQYDENGKLLFFVVDGAIYDHEGYLMADNELRTGCLDCLPRGIQEVSIVLMPGTCDKYYIISGRARRYTAPADPPCQWPNVAYLVHENSALFYSVLDLSLSNRHHAGRLGSVWHYDDLLDQYASNPQLVENMEPQSYFNCLNENVPDGSAIFKLASGNKSVNDLEIINPHNSNIHHVVYDAGGNGSQHKILFIRTGMEFLYAPITADGILNPEFLAWADNDYGNYDDQALTMTGGLSIADTASGIVRLACTIGHGINVQQNSSVTIEILTLNLTGSVPTIAAPRQDAHSYPGANGPGNYGWVRSIAFSPNGRYLYFAQPFAPHVGYFDMWESNLPIHDLEAELGLATGTTAPFGQGQIRLNHTADGLGYAIYFPSANGLGYIEDPDNPLNATWHSTISTTQPLNTPPVSAALHDSHPSLTHYLMDMQNYRDQQIPSLAQPACCLVRMEQSLGNHTYTYNGMNTPATAWTPQNNPLATGGGSLCPPSNPNTSTGTAVAYFTQDFVVQTGARLYVQGMEWRFAPDARLIIQKGAFVKFDNCVLRGGICGQQRWPGVMLEGTPTAGQGANTFPVDQGRMVFENSTLMDALTGVTVGPINKSGGILETRNSIILNCRTGVYFHPYQNHLPNGNPTRNRSKFYKTTFTVDHTYSTPLDFQYHAKLWGVDGIEFLACDFSNQRTTEHNSLALGLGINALDAHFRATGICADPGPVPAGSCQTWNPTTFSGLDMGIRARTGTNYRPFFVEHAHFEDNVCGVYAHSVNNFEVHNSTFLVGSTKATTLDNWPDEKYWNDAHRGIYSYGSNGFLVDDNQLDAMAGATTAELEGIVTGYSYGYNDIVFRNHAQNLMAAYVGEGTCVDLNNRALIGLWYLCNTNDNNDNGIWSRRDGSLDHNPYPDQSIRTNQGTRLRPADNSFGQTPGQLDIKNSNYANNALAYWWTLPQTPYWPEYVSVGVSRDNHDGTGNLIIRDPENCASRIAPLTTFPPNREPAAQRAHLLNEAQARKAAYGNTRYLYDALIDGGSTDETVQEIQSAWPNEAWELRAMLLEKSPYLSNEVLMAVVEKNVLPVAMVAEICIANPEATQREGFMDWLEYKAPINMPGYMLDNIRASWETKTYRTTLENTLAFEHSEMTQALAMLTASYQADTLVEQVDSIRAALQVLRTPAARYHEILTYLQQDNFDSAYAVMDRLPVEFRLRDKQVNEKDRTKQFIGIVQGYRTAGRTSAELTESELTALRNLRDGYYDRPAEWAQNILCFGYGDCRAPRTGGNDDGGLKRMGMPLHTGTKIEPTLAAYPNPADTWTTLQYRLDGMAQEAWLVFRDVTGREVARMPVEQGEGQQVWDTRQVVPGTYMVELTNAGHILGTAKVVVKQ